MKEGAREDAPPLALRDRRGVDQVLRSERPDGPTEHPSSKRGAVAQEHVDREEADADADDADRDVAGVRRVGAAGAVELAPRLEVMARLLQEPGDPVGDRAPFRGRRSPIGLAIRRDRLLEVPIADGLLGRAPPAEPGAAAAGIAGRSPRRQRAGLVVDPVARGPGEHQRFAGNLGVRMAGQRLEDADRGLGVPGVEQAPTLVDGQR